MFKCILNIIIFILINTMGVIEGVPVPAQGIEVHPVAEVIERRATIDVGSNATKITIADVDMKAQKIEAIIWEESFPVPYQASLSASPNGIFDEQIRAEGLRTFHHIKEILDSYQVHRIAAVATAAFRNAANGKEFADEVYKETGIPLRVIPQGEEAALAFFSGVQASQIDPANLIVWDIGGGSFQISTVNEKGEFIYFLGAFGSVTFRNHIIEKIQHKDVHEVTSPNPMTEQNIKAADSYARSLARQADRIVKEKVKHPEKVIVGIGNLFANSIGPLGDGGFVIRKDLRSYVRGAEGLTDDELGNPFANVDVPNAILVLGFMKALHIHEIQILNTKTTRGMLIYPDYFPSN